MADESDQGEDKLDDVSPKPPSKKRKMMTQETFQVGTKACPAQVIQSQEPNDLTKKSWTVILGVQDIGTIERIQEKERELFGSGNARMQSVILADPCIKESNPGHQYHCVKLKLAKKDKRTAQVNQQPEVGEQWIFKATPRTWSMNDRDGIFLETSALFKCGGAVTAQDRLIRVAADVEWE